MVSAALHDSAALPKSLQPLAPLAPILRSALAPEHGPTAAAAQHVEEPDAADGGDVVIAAAAEAGSARAATADGLHASTAAGLDGGQHRAPRRLPAVTALLLAEVPEILTPHLELRPVQQYMSDHCDRD